jgi:hypothetical protein
VHPSVTGATKEFVSRSANESTRGQMLDVSYWFTEFVVIFEIEVAREALQDIVTAPIQL